MRWEAESKPGLWETLWYVQVTGRKKADRRGVLGTTSGSQSSGQLVGATNYCTSGRPQRAIFVFDIGVVGGFQLIVGSPTHQIVQICLLLGHDVRDGVLGPIVEGDELMVKDALLLKTTALGVYALRRKLTRFRLA